jgi:hypothetical protein
MKNSSIKSIELDDACKIYTVYYYSGSVRTFTRNTLPYTALYFVRSRLTGNSSKVFIKKYPKFAGKNGLHIIGELTYYLIVD